MITMFGCTSRGQLIYRTGCRNQMRLLFTGHTRFESNPETETKVGLKPLPQSKIPFVNWIRNDLLKGKIKYNAYNLYSGMTNNINYLNFFKTCKLDDTYNSWFLITELHVWMMMARLRGEGKDGRTATNALVEAMWEDATFRAKVLSPADSSTSKKQIVDLSAEFKGSLLLYDEGLLSTDMVLASALWYRFFSKAIVDPRLLESLVAYIRNQINNLDKTPVEELLLRGKVNWLPFRYNPKTSV